MMGIEIGYWASATSVASVLLVDSLMGLVHPQGRAMGLTCPSRTLFSSNVTGGQSCLVSGFKD